MKNLYNEYFKIVDNLLETTIDTSLNNYITHTIDYSIENKNYVFERTDDAGFIYYLLPGASKDDVSVEINNKNISIEANIEIGNDYEKTIKKSFKVNTTVYDINKIEADVTNGVLTITLPFKEKKEEKNSKRKLL